MAKNTTDYLGDSLELFLELKIGNINELVELREYLESIVVRLAARRASPEDIIQLERANWKFCEPGLSAEEYKVRDFAFHKQLAECSNNSILAELVNSVRSLIQKTLETKPTPNAFTEKGGQYHAQIIEAVRNHDETEAIRVMESYLVEADYSS